MNDTLKTWLTLIFWVATLLLLSWGLTTHEWTPFPDWRGLFYITAMVGAVLGARSAWKDV